ncbi:hypothetical protein FW774_00400 (plasmid) [Pedobacter sp. BS3]|uniref:hypothetical protein n=1 Tax=Pedobacter sp. BS3 TaxID=2567937 RepID=UPI0011EFD3A8|nr:hypothetical protein [Pedobacter sp. BS3]TZF85575.1 hypothetical protein FW774_00400 [Pedobacter sp. BS3]
MKTHYKISQFFVPAALLLIWITGLTSCKKDKDNYPAMPAITIEGDSTVSLKPGDAIVVTVKFDAPGPDTRLLINKNSGPYRSIRLDENAVSYTFNEDMVSETAAEGDSITYEFVLTNGANQKKSSTVSFTANVEVYPTITIGSETLYNVTIPEDGILTSGAITLAPKRKYYISSSIEFSETTKFSAGTGTEIYLNSAATNKINLTFDAGSQVNINGTATEPVVITSDKTLLGTGAAAGDWGVFNIKGDGNGSNSGSVNHLRLEYGGSRAFRLQDVGNGTQVDYVQVYKSLEEAIMVTNGDVNMSHLITTDCQGAGYRLGDAYAGKIQFAIALTTIYTAELDEFTVRETASPVIANLSIIGPGETVNNTSGMRLRAASAAKIYNAIVAFYPRRGVRLNDDVVITDLNGPTVFAYSYVFKVPKDPFRDDRTGGTNPFAGTYSGGVGSNPFFNNITFSSTGVRSYEEIDGIAVGDYTPTATKASAFNPAILNSFFKEAAFVGAIESPDKDWTVGWVRNPDGTIRTAN